MAFHKLKHRILTGSLNLLPPGEKIPEEDSLDITNWLVDQQGQLRSRRGMVHQSGYLAGGLGHTLFRRNPSCRYAGVGGNLYQSYGASNWALIGGNFDGAPLGLAGTKNYTWLMNRGRQGKVRDGATDILTWVPVSPTQAPTAAAGAQETETVATFEEAWSVVKPDGSAGSSSVVSGALEIDCDSVGVWLAKAAIAGDFGIGGEQRADDQFRIRIYASEPASIEEITVAIDVNGGGFDSDYYFCTMPGPGGSGRSPMSDVKESWTQIVMRREMDGSGLAKDNPALLEVLQQLRDSTDELRSAALEQALPTLRAFAIENTPAFVRVGKTAGKDWSTAAAVRVQVRLSATATIRFDDFEVLGGPTSAIEGDVSYYVTFDTDDGHESNGSAPSAEIHLDKQFATLTNIAVSTDPQVTKRHVYRSGASLDGKYRVGTINDNSSTTFPASGQKERTDEEAQSLNELMPEDHDPAPPAKGVTGPYFGKLLAYSSELHPGRFWWTETALPWVWPGSDDEFEGNWEDVGEDSEDIHFVTIRTKRAIFYKSRSIWRLDGDPDKEDPVRTNANIGAAGPRAVCSAGAVDFVGASSGIYEFNGESERDVSGKIKPIFQGQFVTLSYNADGTPDIQISPLNPDQRASMVLEFVNGQVWFSFASGNDSINTKTLILNLETGCWSLHKLDRDNNGAGGFSAIYYEGQDRALLTMVSVATSWPANGTGGAAAAVYEIPQGGPQPTDDGNAIPLVWHSRYSDQGLPSNPKIYGDLEIEYQTGDAGSGSTSALTVSLYFDGGRRHVAIGTLNAAGRTTAVFRLDSGKGLVGKNVAIRIEGNATSECIIFGTYLHWYVDARDGKTFDSGVIDLGSELAKQVDGLAPEIEPEQPGSLTYYLCGDLPGGSVIQRQTGTIALDGTRQRRQFALPSAVEGRRLRLILTADFKIRVHSVAMRVLEIAEYVDGTAGEVWESKDVSYT